MNLRSKVEIKPNKNKERLKYQSQTAMKDKNNKKSHKANLEKRYARKMGLAFAAVLAFFFVLNLIVPDKEYSDQENRTLQTLPGFSISEYTSGRFETKLEDYANDQFVARNAFIKLKTAVDVSAGSIYSNGVWKGKDGYLIEDTTEPYKGKIKKDVEAIASFKSKNPGITMRFMLAPTAVNTYSNKLPLLATPADQNKYMDKFFAGLNEIGVEVVDVREDFKNADEDTQLYYRTDHHWTTEGAKLAFDKFAAQAGLPAVEFETYAVKNDFVGTLASKSGFVGGKADVIELSAPVNGLNSVIYYYDTQEKTTAFYKLKNLNKKDAYTVFGGSNHPLYTVKTPTSENRRLLLIKDSYANSIIPYLAQYYREIVVVDPRYYFDSLEDLILSEQINEVLFLYNANTFFGDDSLSLMLSE